MVNGLSILTALQVGCPAELLWPFHIRFGMCNCLTQQQHPQQQQQQHQQQQHLHQQHPHPQQQHHPREQQQLTLLTCICVLCHAGTACGFDLTFSCQFKMLLAKDKSSFKSEL